MMMMTRCIRGDGTMANRPNCVYTHIYREREIEVIIASSQTNNRNAGSSIFNLSSNHNCAGNHTRSHKAEQVLAKLVTEITNQINLIPLTAAPSCSSYILYIHYTIQHPGCIPLGLANRFVMEIV